MSHTPFGYRIKNGKATIDRAEAEKIRVLFQAYLAGAALTTAAKEAAIHAFHSGIRHILQTTHYIGDDYYSAIIDADTFTAAQRKSPAGPKNWGASGNLKKRHRFYTPPPSPLQKKRKPILIHFSKLNMHTV